MLIMFQILAKDTKNEVKLIELLIYWEISIFRIE